MKSKNGRTCALRLLKGAVVLLCVLALGVWVWRWRAPEPVGVLLAPVTVGPVERTAANTRAGTVKACRRAKLSPSVGGQIARLPIKEGQAVSAGQLLLELWNEDIAAQVLLAEREVVSSRSRAQAGCVKADVAARNAKRLTRLHQSSAISEERLDNAVAEAEQLAAECASLRTSVSVRDAQLALARASLARTRLTAPFDGVIAEINGELFEYVTPSPVGVPTPPAVDILDNTCFYVTAPIDEVDAAAIRVGMPVRLSLDAYRDRHFDGRVRRIADYVLDVEKQARTVDVETEFNPETIKVRLLAGYSADIEVILEKRENVPRVPTEAVVDGREVFVYRPETGRVVRRSIRTGISNWDLTEVIEGVAPGEMVVVNPDHPDLADGVPARPIKEAP
jgi:HlyD family secretion protein